MTIFPLDFEFVHALEEKCLEIARYANQDLEKVERWSLPVLVRRYSTLARIVERENPKSKD